MILKDAPETHFTFKRNLHAEGALAFITQLESLDAETVVGHLTGKLEAARGVWVRIGRYRLATDSFIDPSDLMLYVASYYEPDTCGPIEAVELNHGGGTPEGALHATTLDELLDALAQLDAPESDGALEKVPADADSDTPDQETELPVTPSRLDELVALEPSSASEMRNALVKGWHAMLYEAPDGSSLLVFD